MINVQKRDGRTEKYNVEKIHKMVHWACEGLDEVSVSEVEMEIVGELNAALKDGISTEEIHALLIKAANNLISPQTPNYQYVAARLLNLQLRKQVWGSSTNPPRFYDHIVKMIDQGIYSEDITNMYTEDEIHKLGSYMKNDRDLKFTYCGLQQLVDKYLLKNRTNGKVYETPQYAYMLIAMVLFGKEKAKMSWVRKAYDHFSLHRINLPTPIMIGVRTPHRSFNSCVLIDIDDNRDSLFSTAHNMGILTTENAGIGLNMGRIRPINSPVKGGSVVHTGLIPFLKMYEATVKSCKQSSRGGSANVCLPAWHPEIKEVMVLKNNAGTDDNRVRKLDYTVQMSRIFWQRIIENKSITLLSPHECPGLYDAFGDNDKFDALYLKYEKDKSLQYREKVKAMDFAQLFLKERLETGRIYAMNIDNCYEGGSWDEPPKMTNLCVEIIHKTKPIQNPYCEEGEIGICILSALNILEIKSDKEITSVCNTIVRMLDNLIEYQDYTFPAAENFTKKRRSLGIGITNLAGYLAKNKVPYFSQEALEMTDEYMEKISYGLIEASCSLAEERGPCEKFNETRYSQGIMPVDFANKEAKKLVKRKPSLDWKALRKRAKTTGMRHSTLMAIAPTESSSVIQNSTNGIEPPRKMLIYKASKNGVLKQLVPNYEKYGQYYTMAFDEPADNLSMNKMVATLQKWIDMSISANHYYNYELFENSEVPLSVMLKDMIHGYKLGVKTLYYSVTPDASEDDTVCEGGACSI